MPSFYRMKKIWYKECSDCKKAYEAHKAIEYLNEWKSERKMETTIGRDK